MGEEKILEITHVSKVAKNLNLSLRDIETIWSNFQIFIELELRNINNVGVYNSYFSLLCLKYKNPWILDALLINNTKIIREINFSEYEFSDDFLEALKSNALLEKLRFSVENCKGIICECQDTYIVINPNPPYPYNERTFTFKEDMALNDFITKKDLLEWDNIKKQRAKDFIIEKIEVYNFFVENDREGTA